MYREVFILRSCGGSRVRGPFDLGTALSTSDLPQWLPNELCAQSSGNRAYCRLGPEQEILMSKISFVQALEILDSRGNPTVACASDSTTARSATRRFPPARRPASTRRSSCATATRRATAARACARRSRTSIEHDRAGRHRPAIRPDRRSIDASMIALDGTPNKGDARRQRDARRVDGGRPRGGAVGEAAALRLSRRRRRDAAARAR